MTKDARGAVIKTICKDFNSGMSSFFSASLMMRTLQFLSEKDFAGKDIPYMHAKTIEYLLKQKVCICGTHLDEGSVPYAKVKELIDYLPPQSISTTIGDFKKEAKRRTNSIGNLYALIRDNTSVISQQDDEITELNDELHDIEGKLSGGDVRERVRAISGEIRICDDTIRSAAMDFVGVKRRQNESGVLRGGKFFCGLSLTEVVGLTVITNHFCQQDLE